MAKERGSAAARGLTRAEVAELLGLDDVDVARMDGRELHPVRSSDRVWHYDPAEVRSVLLASAAASNTRPTRPVPDGATTAAVFALFEANKTLPQVVIATKQTAATIVQLRAEYDGMLGGFFVSAPAAEKVRALVGRDVRTGDDLPEAIARALDGRFEEGRAEAHDFGEILDPATGQFRRVEPRAPDREKS